MNKKIEKQVSVKGNFKETPTVMRYFYFFITLLLACFTSTYIAAQGLTTFSFDAGINDSQIVNAELSSALDSQNNTHTAWFKEVDNTRTLVYSLFNNSSVSTIEIQSYPNGTPIAPQITLDENGNPHIVYILKRDKDAGTNTGNYAIMYAGDTNGDGTFEQSQVSTNPTDPEDDTESEFDAYVNGRPTITVTNSGGIKIYYTTISYSGNDFENQLAQAEYNNGNWDRSIAFSADGFVEGTFDVDEDFITPEYEGSEIYVATIDVSDYRPQFFRDNNGTWSKTVLEEYSGIFNNSDVRLVTDNEGDTYMLWMHETDDDDRFIYTKLDGDTYTEPVSVILEQNPAGNLFGYAIDRTTKEVHFYYNRSFNSNSYLVTIDEDGNFFETEIPDIGEVFGKRSLHVNNGFISLTTADDSEGKIYITYGHLGESDGSSITAGFTASSTNIEEGEQVNFTDQSTGEPTSWSWTFEGGTPSSSTEQNPSVVYEIAGSFDVTLIASNENAADTLIRESYITVETADGGGGGSNGIVWEQNYGGSDEESLSEILVTSGNEFILVGTSASNDHDVSENHSGDGFTFDDYWIAKLNSSGEIDWEHNYGGTSTDEAKDIVESNDGGYLIAGDSRSDDGEVGGNYGYSDVWLVKINSTGEIEWQRNYGGSGYDKVESVEQTSDDGYIFAGYSESSDNDVSAHYGSPLRYDYWVAKLDSEGNIEWEQNYGGSEHDYAYEVFEVESGGYLVAGNTESDDYDVENKFGDSQESSDIWILKLNNSGEIEWQKNFGEVDNVYRIRDMTLTSDGGFAIVYFEILMDYWIAKFDSEGELEWKKSYGGSGFDVAQSVLETDDEGLVMAGYSESDGEGFDSDVSGNNGMSDYWSMKVDNTGNLLWEQNFGGSESDEPSVIKEISEGNYIVGGVSESSDIDVSGNYGETDIWVVKFEAGESTPNDDDDSTSTTTFLYEDFDGDTYPPEGWERQIQNNDYTWFQGVFTNYPFSEYDPDDVSSAGIEWIDDDQDEWLISKPFSLEDAANAQLSFYILYGTQFLSNAVTKVHISTDSDSENWTKLWETGDDGQEFSWRKIEIDLSDYDGEPDVKLAWQYVGNDGNSMGLDSIYVYIDQTLTSSEDKRETPKDFVLHQNYPNPFNPSTVISYQVPVNSEVRLKVYDMLGREVATLVNDRKAPGNYTAVFDATRLSSGVYIYRIEAGGFVETKKMLLVK